MNSFFKQLLGSLVQIGINELGRKTRYQGSDIRDQCLRKNDPKNQAREVSIAFRQGDDEGTDEIDLSGHRGRERGSQHSINR